MTEWKPISVVDGLGSLMAPVSPKRRRSAGTSPAGLESATARTERSDRRARGDQPGVGLRHVGDTAAGTGGEDSGRSDGSGDRDRAGDPQAQRHRGREALVRRPHDLEAARASEAPATASAAAIEPVASGRRSRARGGRRASR